jgi:hypothetical protein
MPKAPSVKAGGTRLDSRLEADGAEFLVPRLSPDQIVVLTCVSTSYLPASRNVIGNGRLIEKPSATMSN